MRFTPDLVRRAVNVVVGTLDERERSKKATILTFAVMNALDRDGADDPLGCTEALLEMFDWTECSFEDFMAGVARRAAVYQAMGYVPNGPGPQLSQGGAPLKIKAPPH